MRFRLLDFLILLIFIIPVTSCKKNHYRVDLSGIDVNIKIRRLEKDLFSLNPEDVIAKVPSLKAEYDGFLQLFSLVINAGNINDNSFGDILLRFCSDKQNNEVYALTEKKFPDVMAIEKELDQAFRHYKYYFPEKNVPAVFTCITGFNNSIITGDSVLGIGLDRYLGADCEFYPRLGIFKYVIARMIPENRGPDCIYGWASSEWDFSSLNYMADNLLAEIIHFGKLKYFEKCILPESSDELIFGFTPDQMKFCRNNEQQMWQYLIENNLLFSSDQLTIRKLTGESPFTSYFTKESPGQAAIWLGFRIVESYMIKNPKTGIDELIKNIDFQSILEKAKYSPQ